MQPRADGIWNSEIVMSRAILRERTIVTTYSTSKLAGIQAFLFVPLQDNLAVHLILVDFPTTHRYDVYKVSELYTCVLTSTSTIN